MDDKDSSGKSGNQADKRTGSTRGSLEELVPRIRVKAWWHRHLEPEERRRVLSDLGIRRSEHWAYRFTVMLTLSIIVAVMGLSLNSAAVVIGAMLLAPLMQPVLATGACLSMALFTKSLRAFLQVVAATSWCIFIAFLISKILPEQELTSEVLARTKPDIKDLVVALAAGSAGAYATVREDASASLPGVAVAVALVPPLGSVGVAAEAGRYSEAWGALLLYSTNLSAIIFASISVFVLTGFVPPRRIASKVRVVTVAKLGLAVLVGLIAFPLYRASVTSIESTEDRVAAEAAVQRWLGTSDLQANVSLEGKKVVVGLRGFDRPPPQESLAADLSRILPGSELLVEWVRTEEIAATTTTAPDPTMELERQVKEIVVSWLDETGDDYEIDQIVVEGQVVRIDASGTGSPPSIDDLDQLLDAELGDSFSPRLNWTTRESIRPGADDLTVVEQASEKMEGEVEEWAADSSVVVREFSYDGSAVVIEVAGEVAPPVAAIRTLTTELQQIADDEDVTVEIFFVERLQVSG